MLTIRAAILQVATKHFGSHHSTTLQEWDTHKDTELTPIIDNKYPDLHGQWVPVATTQGDSAAQKLSDLLHELHSKHDAAFKKLVEADRGHEKGSVTGLNTHVEEYSAFWRDLPQTHPTLYASEVSQYVTKTIAWQDIANDFRTFRDISEGEVTKIKVAEDKWKTKVIAYRLPPLWDVWVRGRFKKDEISYVQSVFDPKGKSSQLRTLARTRSKVQATHGPTSVTKAAPRSGAAEAARRNMRRLRGENAGSGAGSSTEYPALPASAADGPAPAAADFATQGLHSQEGIGLQGDSTVPDAVSEDKGDLPDAETSLGGLPDAEAPQRAFTVPDGGTHREVLAFRRRGLAGQTGQLFLKMTTSEAPCQLYDIVNAKLYRGSLRKCQQEESLDFMRMKGTKDDLWDKDFYDLDLVGIATARRGPEPMGGYATRPETHLFFRH